MALIEQQQNISDWTQRSPAATGLAPFEGAEEVFFDQTFGPWAELPYFGLNVGYCGCGMTALACAVDILTGARYTPEDIWRMRDAWGADQTKEGQGGMCACDAHPEFAQLNAELFGIQTQRLTEKTVEACKRALAGKDAVIWASSRNVANPWIYADGRHCPWQHIYGHLVCIWKYEDGHFYIKDSAGPAWLCNNVPYTEVQLDRWLQGVQDNFYLIRALP